MMQVYIVESICRDGCAALNIPMKPDGSIEPNCEKMLEEVGVWMKTNGEAIYGSKAWKVYGEGQLDKNGKILKLPGHALKQQHADFPFTSKDIRFTVGKNSSFYAFCMKSPQPGEKVIIKSMGKKSGLIMKVKQVSLLGYNGKIKWHQTNEALEISCPEQLPFSTIITFRIK